MATDLFKFKFSKARPMGGGISEDFLDSEKQLSLSESTFLELRDIIYKQSGIYYTESKKYLLEGRLAKRIVALNLNSFEEYINVLKSIRFRDELDDLFEVITINETYFFRAPQQFEAFENIVIPEIMKSRLTMSRPTFRIWSAASSTGEEAYTIAILILEKLRHQYPQVQFQVLGSDINNAVLDTARAGIYKEYSIRNMPVSYLNKYFRKSGSTYILNDEVKKMVRFMNINLYDSVAIQQVANCDVIFCCNVLIYFDIPSKQQAVSYLYNSLNKGGYLFIGYSESLHGISKAFKLVHLPKAMAYKRE